MKFPKRVYTYEEVKMARSLIEKGYRHRLRLVGSSDFKEKVRRALKLIKTAGYYDFLRVYIRRIVEVKGFSQLREADASIWANKYAVKNPVEAASFLVQKAWQMKAYLDGVLYFDIGEFDIVKKRLEFLKVLSKKSRNPAVREECKKRLKLWDESKFL